MLTRLKMATQKFIGFFLGGLVGDVVGSHFEGKDKNYYYDFNTLYSKEYTDDTEMTMVLTKHLLKNKGMVLSFELHQEFAIEAQLHGFRGYTVATRSLFEAFLQGRPYKKKSTANGCLMRIGVLGLFQQDDKILVENIKKAIEYTHGSFQENVICCFIHCKVIQDILQGVKTPKQILDNMLEISKNCTNLYIRLKILMDCLTTGKTDINLEITGYSNFFQIQCIDLFTCAYYYIFKHWNDPENAILESIRGGGDTDTIAKIVGEIMGLVHGYQWIPEKWKGLENERLIFELGNQVALFNDNYAYDPRYCVKPLEYKSYGNPTVL